jgi:hypothetical protein
MVRRRFADELQKNAALTAVVVNHEGYSVLAAQRNDKVSVIHWWVLSVKHSMAVRA